MTTKVIGFDIGGTNLRAALVDRDGGILYRYQMPSNASKGIDAVLGNLTAMIEEIAESHKISGIGIGFPSIIDSQNGVLLEAPNIAGVKNYPIRKALVHKLNVDIPIEIENDANCAVLGEWWRGAGKDTRSMAMITLGTGVGGGLILDGSIWSGEGGTAGEIGHMTIDPEGPKCNCGNYGCLESYSSATAVKRLAREAAKNNSESLLSSMLADVEDDEIPKYVLRAAEQGDKEAREIWRIFGRALGTAIANIVNLLNIEVIVVGGGVSKAHSMFWEHMVSEAKKRCLKSHTAKMGILKSALGEDAGVLGASYLVLKR